MEFEKNLILQNLLRKGNKRFCHPKIWFKVFWMFLTKQGYNEKPSYMLYDKKMLGYTQQAQEVK